MTFDNTSDVIILSNDADNTLSGNAEDDTILGDAVNDTISDGYGIEIQYQPVLETIQY